MIKLPLALILICLVLNCAAQNPAAPAYQGMQPDLVHGVEDGMATDKPKLRHVYLAAPEVLAVVVDAQNIWSEPLQKYEAQPGDEIRRSRPQNYGTQGHAFYWGRELIRNGEKVGQMVGAKEDYYSPPMRLRGEALDLAWADKPESYAISSSDDPAYQKAATPLAVFRKTTPEMFEWTDKGILESSHRHNLYLKLPHALQPGKNYSLEFLHSTQLAKRVDFVFNDQHLRTEAIQVNQAGYHPAQAEKVARVSMWLGNGGGADFSKLHDFTLLNEQDWKEVFRGPITLRRAGVPAKEMAPEKTADPNDDLPMTVYQLDFSKFAQPGIYRVSVAGLGVSFPFRIDENVWVDGARMAAHGYFNQRSGIAHGLPYSKFPRPRDLYPEDGFKVRRTDPAIYFDEKRFPPGGKDNSGFKRIQASILEDTEVPEAWGGWHDAADYDRDVDPQNHMRAVHAMLSLVESNPAFFEKLSLNIPESGNAIPDLIDEALWCTELFRRIQQPDGGIPGAIESLEHPSEPSWLLGQPTAMTPPSPRSCQRYAAAAARMSLDLKKYDPVLAEKYRDSAVRAMQWADAKDKKNSGLAAFWMFRLTGDAAWQKRFQQSLGDSSEKLHFDTSDDGPWPWVDYALLPDGIGDTALRAKCRTALLKAADADVETTNQFTWNLGPERYAWNKRLGDPQLLIAAHRLSGDAKYLRAIEQLAQFSLGLNPTNASYTTGVGSRQVVVFNIEAHYLGSAAPEGITGYGPGTRNIWRGATIEKNLTKAGLYPDWKKWPWAESSFDMREPNLNEYTVGGNMANQLLMRAYLAQALH